MPVIPFPVPAHDAGKSEAGNVQPEFNQTREDLLRRMTSALTNWCCTPGCQRTRLIVYREAGIFSHRILELDPEALRRFVVRRASMEQNL